MASIKRNSIVIVVAATLVVAAIFGVHNYSAQAVETEELNAISRSCSTIKQTLSQLQHADSRTRTYLGATYETIAGSFIIPLNLRLVKLNQPDPELLAVQADFTASQDTFRTAYTDYMRDLENLINIDCASRPQDFYQQLEVVRAHRSKLHETALRLAELTERQYQLVLQLQEKLKNGK